MSSTKWILRLGILRLLFQVVNAQDYVYEKVTAGGYVCSASYNDITSSADCQTAATDGEGNWISQIDSALFPSGCSYEFGSGDIHYNIKAQGSDLYPDGTTYAIIRRQSTTTVTTVTTTTSSSTTTSTSSTTSSTSSSTSSTSTSSSSTSSSSTSSSSTSSSTTSTSSSTFTSTSTTSSSTSSTSTSSTTTTTTTTPPDLFNISWAESYVRPVKNTEIALSCYPTSCNEHAVAFLAAIDPLSQLVDSSCDLTETPQQPLTVYDSMSARVVVKTTTPNYLYPQEGSSPIVDYKSAWEPVVAWTVNWTLKVVEGQELRMGRSYRLCVDRTGPGGYNGLQLSDVQDMFEVYVAGIRSADSGIMVSNNSKLQVLCEAMGDLYHLGCQTYASYSVSSGAEVVNPGATSAYLAVSCDTSDNDGLRDGTYDNESASSYLMGDGNPYFYLEWDTRDMQLGVHYRLCEDLDGTNSIAGFNWPGIVVYLGGVTSISTVLRDPKDGPVVIAAENQGLLLNCLYGACSSSTEAYLGASCDSSDNSTDRSEWATFTFRGSSEEWQWQLKQWDLTNLTNGTTYKLCTDFDGQDQGPLHSGFSGIMVPVTPITQISEETIQAATDQQVLLVCHGCFHTERFCDAIVGCPATDPIYIVSSAYLSNHECNYSDYDGFQMDEGDWTTMSAPLRPTTNSTRASSLSASPGKDSIVYNTEVIFDASATIIGTRYRSLSERGGI